MTRRFVALSIAGFVIGVLAPAAAGAANFNNSVSIAIDSKGNAFKGKVHSPKNACIQRRKVTLERKKSGQANFTKVGSDTANANGAWTVDTNPVEHARYRAAIDAKKLNRDDKCKGSKSSVTNVRPSKVTIQRDAGGFSGVVLAPAVCTPRRTVHLRRKTVYQESFRSIGSDVTNRFGDWAVATNVIADAQYRARVAARQDGDNSCLDDLSPRIVG